MHIEYLLEQLFASEVDVVQYFHTYIHTLCIHTYIMYAYIHPVIERETAERLTCLS